MKNKILEFNLPAYWASYLINGDASGITSAEQAAIDTFCTAKGVSGCAVECGESFFHHKNDANNIGGDVCQFTFLVPEKEAA